MNREETRREGKKAFSLSELTASIKAQIDKIYRKPYWIKAEINRLNYYPHSGHCYPELVEKKDNKIVAQIRGLIFRNSYEEIHRNFLSHTKKELGDGMEVLLLCQVRFDPKYGLSLIIQDIDPSFTLGEMARLRTEALKRLKREGLFDKNRALYRPKLIKRLAVISVETSKGWRDFAEVIDESPYGKLIKRDLFTAKLQGDEAVESIGKALKKIASRHQRFDAVAIIRGGGGETGMDCYDHYQLGKMVASFPIPVLTGIGHSTNLTLVEMCSHKNLITPTALAQFITDEFFDFEERIYHATKSLKRVGRQLLPLLINRLDGLTEKLERSLKQKLENEEERLLFSGRQLEKSVGLSLKKQRERVDFTIPYRIKTVATEMLRAKKQDLNAMEYGISGAVRNELTSRSQKLEHLSEKLKILDPANILQRGYSITTKNGKAVTSTKNLRPGDEVTTRLASGIFTGTVKNTENG